MKNGTSCSYYGEVRSVYLAESGYMALVDFMVLLTDTLDVQAMRDAGDWDECLGSPSGLFIVNHTQRIDTLMITHDAPIRLRFGDGGVGNDTIVRVNELHRALTGEPRRGVHWYGVTQENGVAGHMRVENGQIVSFDQQYFP